MMRESLGIMKEGLSIDLCEMNKIVGIKLFDLKYKKERYRLRYVTKTNLYILVISDEELGTEEVLTGNSYIEILANLLDKNKRERLENALMEIL